MSRWKAVSCTPCNRTMWKLLKAIEAGDARFHLKADSELFDHLRHYERLEDVPCCAVSER
jgi:hypothetical protein